MIGRYVGRSTDGLFTAENRELENFREGEIREMIDIYIERGMDADDAEVKTTKTKAQPPSCMPV